MPTPDSNVDPLLPLVAIRPVAVNNQYRALLIADACRGLPRDKIGAAIGQMVFAHLQWSNAEAIAKSKGFVTIADVRREQLGAPDAQA